MEAMAAESIVGTVWELEGFLTKVRWPVKVDGGYSDIDVVGVNAAGTVRLAECKVRGPARQVLVVATDFESWLGDWGKSVDNIERLWSEAPRPAWLPPRSVARIEMWFCANVWFARPELHAAAEARFTKLVASKSPHGLKGSAVGRIRSTRDLLVDIVSKVRTRVIDHRHGKRFGNPILDAVRELIRYTSPTARDGGYGASEQIAAETRDLLIAALRLGAAR